MHRAAPPTAKEWQRVREGGRRLRRWARVKPKTEEAAGIQFWPCGSGCSGGGGGGSSSQAYVTSDPYPGWHPAGPQQTWNIQLFMPQLSFFTKICWVQLARPPGDSGKLLRGENSFRSGSIRRTKQPGSSRRSVKFTVTLLAPPPLILNSSTQTHTDKLNFHLRPRVFADTEKTFCLWFIDTKGQSTSLFGATRHSHSWRNQSDFSAVY